MSLVSFAQSLLRGRTCPHIISPRMLRGQVQKGGRSKTDLEVVWCPVSRREGTHVGLGCAARPPVSSHRFRSHTLTDLRCHRSDGRLYAEPSTKAVLSSSQCLLCKWFSMSWALMTRTRTPDSCVCSYLRPSFLLASHPPSSA